MKLYELPDLIRKNLEAILVSYNDIKEIWLFGSRSNGTESDSSDWDFLIFADEKLLSALRQEPKIKNNIDILVVYDGDHFEDPWPRDSNGKFKKGNLKDWEWKQVSLDEAEYVGTKAISNSIHVNVMDLKALKVYP